MLETVKGGDEMSLFSYVKQHKRPRKIGPIQLCILRCIRKSPKSAYGVGIAEQLRKKQNVEIADAQVHLALQRLLVAGMIVEVETPSSQSQELPSSRRGRPRKYYTLAASGVRALDAVDATENRKSPQRNEVNNETRKPPRPALVG